ncbi:MAG: hypothetical protein JOS17DRAFT_456060 [Linnemannia elongata]|nr:MAG: hypothetical protein JOS17DRAFT_456060 [Linnemannia elongata]
MAGDHKVNQWVGRKGQREKTQWERRTARDGWVNENENKHEHERASEEQGVGHPSYQQSLSLSSIYQTNHLPRSRRLPPRCCPLQHFRQKARQSKKGGRQQGTMRGHWPSFFFNSSHSIDVYVCRSCSSCCSCILIHSAVQRKSNVGYCSLPTLTFSHPIFRLFPLLCIDHKTVHWPNKPAHKRNDQLCISLGKEVSLCGKRDSTDILLPFFHSLPNEYTMSKVKRPRACSI